MGRSGTAWRVAWAIGAAGCVNSYQVAPSFGTSGSMQAWPSVKRIAPVGDDETGAFCIRVRGRDSLAAVSWLSVAGGDLLVEGPPDLGPYFIGATGTDIPMTYRVGSSLAPADTASGDDAGAIRLFFERSPSVDVWVTIDPETTDAPCFDASDWI